MYMYCILYSENSWKQTDAAQNREQSAQEQLYEMREKMEKLQSELKKSDKKDGNEE